jgi:hypothetical protein
LDMPSGALAFDLVFVEALAPSLVDLPLAEPFEEGFPLLEDLIGAIVVCGVCDDVEGGRKLV